MLSAPRCGTSAARARTCHSHGGAGKDAPNGNTGDSTADNEEGDISDGGDGDSSDCTDSSDTSGTRSSTSDGDSSISSSNTSSSSSSSTDNSTTSSSRSSRGDGGGPTTGTADRRLPYRRESNPTGPKATRRRARASSGGAGLRCGQRQAFACDMGVATFNLNRLRDQLKLDLVLEGLQQHGVHVLLGQETWHAPTTHLRVPEAWTLFSFPHPTMGEAGRGLLVLVSRACLRARGWRAEFVSRRSTEHHDYLVIKVGPWLLASVYVPCTRTTGPRYRELAQELAALRTSPRQRLIVGGDLNWPERRQDLEAAFYDVLGLLPLLQPPLITRPASNGERGSLIDNIFYSEEQDLRLAYAGPMDLEPSPLLEAYMDGPRQMISDHYLVVGQLPIACPRPAGPKAPAQAAAPAQRISYRRLEHWIQADQREQQQQQTSDRDQQAAARLRQLREQLQAVCGAGITDLGELRDRLKQALQAALGLWTPRTGVRQAHMTDPAARQALRQRQHQRKRFYQAARRGASPSILARHQQELNVATHHWGRAQSRAQAAAKLDAFQRCQRVCEETGGNVRAVFKTFRQAKGRARMVVRHHPHLKPEEVATFWAGVYTRRRADVRHWPPYCQVTLIITAEMVIEAIEDMERRAPGPDGMDFLVFSYFKHELAPALAQCYTRMAREGPPAALREALTILGPKAGNENCSSSSPADYRPITLLDMVMRIFHKILHRLLSQEMEARTPQRGGIHRTQAGFRRQRSCLEQAFFLQLLQAVRRETGGAKQFLGGVLLDIKKAFDSFEYEVILSIMHRRGYPLELLEILRKFLPGNFTSIMGKRVALGRGSPQGGAISPDLCLIMMDDFAADLQRAIEQDPELGDLWRHGRTAQEHEWQPQRPHPQLGLWMTLLQFADDITLLAGSPRLVVRLMEVAVEWAERVGLELSNKTLLVLLSARSRQHVEDLGLDEPLVVGGMRLQWQTREAFRVLGVTCQAAFSSHRFGPRVPLDDAKAQRLLGAISAPFSFGTDKYYVDPLALRLGIEQLLHASLLFQTAVVDIDYAKLQSKTIEMVRRVLQLQPTTPTAYIQWEVRLWPPRLRAHKRCLMFLYKIMHHTWVGEQLLRPYLAECARRDRPVDDLHPVFDLTPLKRMGDVLKVYGITWYHVYGQWGYPYDQRDQLAAKIDKELLLPAFVTYLRQQIEKGTPGLPPHHRQQLLRDMRLPLAKDAAREAAHLPLYLSIGQDLPRAAILFRAPYLRFQPRGVEHRRHSCMWCGEDEGECGYHLLRCPRMPRAALVLRNRALLLQRQDAALPAVSLEEELDRLFALTWRGSASWRPGRPDRGRQPGREALEATLIYMRDALNLYSRSDVAVWPLPCYTARLHISSAMADHFADIAPGQEV